MGLLDEARRYHQWVHRNRREVLYSSRRYRRARLQLQFGSASDWDYVKVVRDPVARCVSSYRHALLFGYEDARMSEELGSAVDHRQGFSYQTFLEYLARINLASCNVHHRLQAHALDRSSFGRVWFINADGSDLDSSLAAIDEDQGVFPSGGSEGRSEVISAAARRHAREISREQDDSELWKKSLIADDTRIWPGSRLRDTPEASARVKALYAVDYQMIRSLSARSVQPWKPD